MSKNYYLCTIYIYHKYELNEAATYSLELDKQKKASIIPKDK
jgi:hypothetical protein